MKEEDKNKKEDITAAGIVFETVYQVSEDMLGLVHKIVSDNSLYERAFTNMCKKLDEVHSNLKKHVMAKKWIPAKGKKGCKTKLEQTEEIMKIATDYAVVCRQIADEFISLTEKLERNQKLKGMIKELVDRLDLSEKQKEKDQESKDEDSDDSDEE